jgi:fucose permease
VSAIPGYASRLFLSGTLAFFVAGMLPSLHGVALPIWSEAYGLGEGEGGTLLAANGAGSLLAVLSGVFGLPFLGMRTGLAVLAAGATLLALGGSWPLTLLGGFTGGFGFGLLTTSVNRAFLGGFGPRSAGMVGLVNAVYGIGAILSPLLFLLLGARPPLAFAALVLLAALALLLSERDAVPPSRGLPDLRNPRLLVTLFILGNGLIEGISVGFGASALTDAGLSASAAARTASAFFLAYVGARLLLTWIAGRIPPARLLTLGFAGAGLSMALAALGLTAPGYILAGAFIGMIFPSYYVWASRILGPDPRMTAAILTVALTGGTLAPLALRPLLAVTGESGTFAVVAGVALLMATLFALLHRRAEALAP